MPFGVELPFCNTVSPGGGPKHFPVPIKTNFERRKIAVFWVVAPGSLVEVYQRFRGPCCLHHQGDE
jgi:hypothetical protein